MNGELLHKLAREIAGTLVNPDKKQLRFNDIVDTANAFYASPEAGVRELIAACDKDNAELYVPKSPMWQSLRENYQWMLQ